MLRTYEIVNLKGVSCGILTYDTEKDSYEVDTSRDYPIEDMPAFLATAAYQGMYHLDNHYALMFVRERVIPPDRQNIGEILRIIGAPYYTEFVILDYLKGRCVRDEFTLREITQ